MFKQERSQGVLGCGYPEEIRKAGRNGSQVFGKDDLAVDQSLLSLDYKEYLNLSGWEKYLRMEKAS